MKAARTPRADKRQVRLLIVQQNELMDRRMESLPDQLRSGDLLVVNDAATLPASLHGHDTQSAAVGSSPCYAGARARLASRIVRRGRLAFAD